MQTHNESQKNVFHQRFFLKYIRTQKNHNKNKKKINKMLHAKTLSLSFNHVLKLPPSGILKSSAITQPLPPPWRISRQISEHLVFTHANLSFTKRNFLPGKSLNLSLESQNPSRIKADPSKRKTKTFTYLKKKNNTINKQTRPIQTNKNIST